MLEVTHMNTTWLEVKMLDLYDKFRAISDLKHHLSHAWMTENNWNKMHYCGSDETKNKKYNIFFQNVEQWKFRLEILR